MKRIIDGKVYSTETAVRLLHAHWQSYHPNQGGGEPTLDHERSIYRTKKGKLFAYKYDDIGYGRDRNGVTGMYTRHKTEIEPLVNQLEAVWWCEQHDCFKADDIQKHFGDALEDA